MNDAADKVAQTPTHLCPRSKADRSSFKATGVSDIWILGQPSMSSLLDG